MHVVVFTNSQLLSWSIYYIDKNCWDARSVIASDWQKVLVEYYLNFLSTAHDLASTHSSEYNLFTKILHNLKCFMVEWLILQGLWQVYIHQYNTLGISIYLFHLVKALTIKQAMITDWSENIESYIQPGSQPASQPARITIMLGSDW